MAIRAPFAPSEWYHCYNRGVEGRKVFCDKKEYERFLQLLFLSNSQKVIHRSNLLLAVEENIFDMERGEAYVDIGAYCLMPNHFHLLLRERGEGGVTTFMRKLMTSYTMYFNIKHQRVGNLFMKPFRSRHVHNDRYFQRVLQYIHCNPVELYEPGWKKGNVSSLKALQKKLHAYGYSSFAEHAGIQTFKSPILSKGVFDIAHQVPPQKMLAEARAYYQEMGVGSSTYGKVSP